jgi:hypothetical protein
MSSRLFSCPMVVALALLVSRPAVAQSPADVESAQELYRQGMQLRVSGDAAHSLERFKAAYALVPTPITALELGRTYQQLGLFVEAHEVLRSIHRMPHRRDESAKSLAARDEAAKLAEDVAPHIAWVTIHVSTGNGPAARLTIDGAEVPPEALLAPRALDPGHHSIVASANGREARSELDLRDGERREVDAPLPPPDTSATQAGATPPGTGTESAAVPLVLARSPDDAGIGMGAQKVVALVAGGIGVVGIGVGTGFGIATISKKNAAQSACPGQCATQAGVDQWGDAVSTGNVSTLGFIVGGVGLAAGAVLWLTAPSGEAGARVGIGPGAVDVHAAW